MRAAADNMVLTDDNPSIPEVELTDGGHDWGFECPTCGANQLRGDALAEGDVLVCEECSQKVRVI